MTLFAILAAIATVLVVDAVLFTVLARRFRRRAAAAMDRVAAAGRRAAPVVPDLAALPEPMRRWAEHAGIAADGPVPRGVYLVQEGAMATRPDRWQPLAADQVMAADPPGFVWRCRLTAGRWLWVDALDRLVDGQGGLDARIWGLVPAMRVSGDAVTAGELYRWLAELVWLPTALLGHPAITWRYVDDAQAEATWRGPGLPAVSVTFRVASDGRLLSAAAEDRPRMTRGGAVPTAWHATFADEEAPFGPWRLPVGAEVAWVVEGRRLPYFRGRFVEATYDAAGDPDAADPAVLPG
jgi:hypothetical protein